MKKWILIATICLCGLNAFATETEEEKEANQNSVRMMNHATKLWKNGQYLEAMDSASLALSTYEASTSAKNFIRKHWNETLDYGKYLIEHNTNTKDLKETKTRMDTYRMLMEINDNLKTCRLPIQGPNNRWLWMPDIQYWDGYYNEEAHLYRILKKKQEELEKALEKEKELTLE